MEQTIFSDLTIILNGTVKKKYQKKKGFYLFVHHPQVLQSAQMLNMAKMLS